MEKGGNRNMVDAPGLLLVIDRLGRTIAGLEQRNAELEQQLAELQAADDDVPPWGDVERR